MNKAIILYDNVMRVSGAVTSYSGTEESGFEVENAYDWRDFSLFRAEDGDSIVDTIVEGETFVDCAVVWFADREDGAVIQLFAELTTGVFTLLATFTLENGGQTMQITSFTGVTIPDGKRLRWYITAGAEALDIRQLCAGRRLVNPIGQYVGQTPVNLFQGVVTNNVIAVNGSIIGRNYRRLERRDTIKWDYVTPEFVRDSWEPFTKHCARRAFFYQWAPTDFPQEVAMASMEELIAPSNMMPPPKMLVTMPILALVGEESEAGDAPTPDAAPVALTSPEITAAVSGSEAEFDAGTYGGAIPITLTYRWFLDGVLDGTGDSYTPDIGDVGKELVLEETATNAYGFVVQTSDPFEITTGVPSVPVSGYTVWLEPSYGKTEVGGEITSWLDKSGYGNHFTQVANDYPIAVAADATGYTSLGFDRTRGLRCPTTIPWDPVVGISVVLVAKGDAAAGGPNQTVIWSTGGTPGTFNGAVLFGSPAFSDRSVLSASSYGVSGSSILSNSARSADPEVVVGRANTIASLAMYQTTGGHSVDSAWSMGVTTTPATALTAIGFDTDPGGDGFTGKIYEVLIFPRRLTNDETNDLIAWAEAKYSI